MSVHHVSDPAPGEWSAPDAIPIDSNHSDRALVERLLAGDESSFERFFERFFSGLYRFALVRLERDEDAAEEVAQATLSKAVMKLETYRGEAALFTWLCTFCRHEIAAFFRRRGRGQQVELLEDRPEIRSVLESLGTTLDGPERAFERAELGRLVRVALDQLPTHYGNALSWKYLDELPVKEIARRLQLSPKAAESLLTRSRAAFREGFDALTRPLHDGVAHPRQLESSP